jgi:hypothetical protein
MTEQPKEYSRKYPGFEVKSGTPDAAGKKIDYAVFTDNGQGFEYTVEGNYYERCDKTSYELCGAEITDEKQPAKVIKASNGNINIEAPGGEVIIRAKSIRLVAEDGQGEITLTALKAAAITAPVQTFKGANSNTVMTNSLSLGAQVVESSGNIQNSANSGADDTESSILNKLLKINDKFKKFLKACLGG